MRQLIKGLYETLCFVAFCAALYITVIALAGV